MRDPAQRTICRSFVLQTNGRKAPFLVVAVGLSRRR